MSTQGTGRIVYLNVGDQVNVGDATGKVIGPVNTNEISPYAYTSITKEKERFIRYENNCSLAVFLPVEIHVILQREIVILMNRIG